MYTIVILIGIYLGTLADVKYGNFKVQTEVIGTYGDVQSCERELKPKITGASKQYWFACKVVKLNAV